MKAVAKIVWSAAVLVGAGGVAAWVSGVGDNRPTEVIQPASLSRSSAWTPRIESALQRAASERKDTLLWFSGSGWNAASDAAAPALCSATFVQTIAPSYVLARADFPSGKSQAPVDPQHTMWAERLAVTQLPALVALDSDGRPYGLLTDIPNDPAACIEQVRALQQRRIARDEALERAKHATGLDRAQELDRALEQVQPFTGPWYTPFIQQIVTLDPGNLTGLESKYGTMLSDTTIDQAIQQEIYPLLDVGQYETALARLDTLIRDARPTVEQRQLLTAFKAQVAYSQGNMDQATRWLDDALALAPQGPAADRVRHAKSQIMEATQAAAEEAVVR